MIQIVSTKKAPKAIGPYSQAIKSRNMFFISGQLPIDPVTNEAVKQSYSLQTKRCMENIIAILEEYELSINNLVKTTIYINDLKYFTEVNETYASFFDEYFPSRACVEVNRLPKDALVEIEAIAVY